MVGLLDALCRSQDMQGNLNESQQGRQYFWIFVFSRTVHVYKQFMSLTPVHDKKPLNTGLRIHIPLHAKSGSNALDAMKRYAQN